MPLAAATCRWLPLANHLQSDTLWLASGDVEEPPDRFPDDVAGRGVIGFGPRFDRRLQLGVDPHRDDIGWTRGGPGRASYSVSERSRPGGGDRTVENRGCE